MPTLIILYFEFFKVGLFAIGGGLATLPFLYDLADKYPWITDTMIGDMIAISESTPGAMGINMATYVGFQNCGVIGGITTTLGLISPSIIVIIIIANALTKFKESSVVKNMFYVLRPMATGLIAAAGLSVIMLAIFGTSQVGLSINGVNFKAIILFIAIYIFIKKTKFHPVAAIALSGIIGVIFSF